LNNLSRWFVYILECEDKSLYVGATNNIERRLQEHMIGKGSKFVRSRKANKIVYKEGFENKYDAYRREKQIKGFSRQKKLELIE
jgi:putative endonuclease